MKQRLLVMNGQRIVQIEQSGKWHDNKVEKAGTLKPGIYPLYLANQADKAKSYDGVVLHVDKEHVYQQVGKGWVKHNHTDFDKVPEIGSATRLTYDQGRAVISAATIKLGRGLSR